MGKIRPFIKSVVFVAGLIVILKVCDFIFAPSGYVRFALHEVNAGDTEYDAVILGASHARGAIDPDYIDEALGTNTFNLAIPGETVSDSYYCLKDAIDSNHIKRVYLDVDYQYWLNGQSKKHFTKAFVYSWIMDLDTRVEYVWDNRDSLDIRNFLSKRLSWKFTQASVENNVTTKLSDSYSEYDIEAAKSGSSYVEGAYGPYKGKGFFYRVVVDKNADEKKFVRSFCGREDKGLDSEVTTYFEKIYELCRENNIGLVCLTSPVTPSAMQDVNMQLIHDTIKDYLEKYNVEYYDFNMALMDFIPRQDSDYCDYEGHMSGKLAEEFSKKLAQFLVVAESGEYQESDYFYKDFATMFSVMRDDYTRVSGIEWDDSIKD